MSIASCFTSIRPFALGLTICLSWISTPCLAQDSTSNDADLRARLAKDSFFAEYKWERLDLGPSTSDASFIVLWDASETKADDETNPKFLGRFGGWLRSQAKTIQDAAYLPSEFKSDLAREVVPIVILRSRQRYEEWQATHASREHRSFAGLYDPKLGALICHPDMRGIGEASQDLRNFILHLHVRQLMKQAAPELVESSAQWLVLGLSDLLSTAPQTTSKGSIEPYLYHQGLRYVLKVLSNPKNKKTYWIPASVELNVQGEGKRLRLPIDIKKSSKSKKTHWVLLYYFDQEAMLWVHFVLGREGGEQALGQCVQEALKGPLSAEKAVQLLGFDSVQAADEAMYRWLEEIAKPVGGVDLKAIVKKNQLAKAQRDSKKKKSKSDKAVVEKAEVVVAPKPTLQPFTPEQSLALALYQAKNANFDQAILTLEKAASAAENPASITSELKRMQALVSARDLFLTAAAKEGKKLRFPLGEKPVLIKAKGWKDGVLSLSPTRKVPLEQIPNAKLDSEFLALNWKKLPAEMGPNWLYGYVLFLAGDKRWQRAMRDSDPNPTAELRNHGDWVANGVLLEFLKQEELNQPSDMDDSELAEVCNTFFKTMPLAESEDFFRAAIMSNLDRKAQALTAEDFVEADLEPLGEGRVRLKYAFDNPKEIRDFNATPKIWQYARINPADPIPADQAEATLGGGRFTFNGEHSYGHKLQWTGPFTVHCTYELVHKEGVDTLFFFWIGLWNEDRKPWVRSEFHTLVLHPDPQKTSKRLVGQGQSTAFDIPFKSTLAFDGKKAYLTLNDSPAIEGDFPALSNGIVALWSQSQFPIHVHELIIEGTVSPESLTLLRGQWVDARMSDLGLPPESDAASDH